MSRTNPMYKLELAFESVSDDAAIKYATSILESVMKSIDGPRYGSEEFPTIYQYFVKNGELDVKN